jgi:hypothetical protein
VNRRSRVQNIMNKTGDNFVITSMGNSELLLVIPFKLSLQDTKDLYIGLLIGYQRVI